MSCVLFSGESPGGGGTPPASETTPGRLARVDGFGFAGSPECVVFFAAASFAAFALASSAFAAASAAFALPPALARDDRRPPSEVCVLCGNTREGKGWSVNTRRRGEFGGRIVTPARRKRFGD